MLPIKIPNDVVSWLVWLADHSCAPKDSILNRPTFLINFSICFVVAKWFCGQCDRPISWQMGNFNCNRNCIDVMIWFEWGGECVECYLIKIVYDSKINCSV